MAATAPPGVEAAQRGFRDKLFEAGILAPTGVDGVYLRSGLFESIISGIDELVSNTAADQHATEYHFPLVVPRRLLEQTDYIRSFPDLTGSLASFTRGDSGYPALLASVDAGADWSSHLDLTDLALCSAACHPLYPVCPKALPRGGLRYEVSGQVFRHEPSVDPARMQVFRQHEVVFVGEPEGARAHRDLWIERGLTLHDRLGLDVDAVVANDPFFGRSGHMLAANQRSEALKIELVAAISSKESPTAITSANCHLDHFGTAFTISCADGRVAHSSCVGFGVERIALALLAAHGLSPQSWPAAVRRALGR